MNRKPSICLLYSIVLLFVLKANAQPPAADDLSKYSFNYRNIIPGMPENASLGAYGNVPISTGKGTPNISFNLYTLSKGGVNVPISISYQASGIRFNDIPSVVGMKWSLDAGGSVNRSVNGIIDEDYLLNNLSSIDPAHIAYQNLHVNSYETQDSSKRIAKQSLDVSLDDYFYNFPGHGGSMYLGPDQVFRADKEYRQLRISYTNHLDTFIIKDNAGNTYIFGGYADHSTIYNTGKYNKQALSSTGARVSWKLQKIITANKQEIVFEYTSYTYEYSSLDSERWTVYITPQGGAYAPCETGYYYIGTNEDAYQTTQFTNTAWLLTKISTDDQEVLFNYHQESELAIFQKKLASIKIYSKISADTVKQFAFSYNGDYLADFTEIDQSGRTEGKKHSFMYYNGGSPLHPFTKDRDIYGYYNGSSNSTLMANAAAFSYGYSWPMADRLPRSSSAIAGTLSDIFYPTGGHTTLEYEYNMWDNGSDMVYAPGLRVKSIRDADITGKVYNEKKFHYSPVGGANYDELTINNEDPAYLEPTMVGVFNSEDDHPFDRNNFFYGKVVIENTGDGSGPAQFETDHYDIQFDLFQKHSPLLVKKEIFVTDTLHLQQSVEYRYTTTWMDEFKIASYLLRKAVPHLGNYSYEGSSIVYPCCLPTTIYQGFDLNYVLRPVLYDLDTVITKEFTPAGDSLVTTVTSSYDGYGLLQSSKTTGSDGVVTQVNYTYPSSYPANPVLAQMKDSFVVSPVVEEQYLVQPYSIVKKKKENTYAFNDGGFFTVSGQTVTDVPTGKTQTLNYYGYNPKAQPLATGRTDDVTKSYIWDYLDELPIAEAVNADTLSIAYTSFEADGKGRWSFSGTPAADSTAVTGKKTYALSGGSITKSGLSSGEVYLLSYWSKGNHALLISGTEVGWPRTLASITVKGQDWKLYEHKITGQTSVSLSGSIAIDELRFYPEQAQMSSYTYAPLVGITSQCDANGRIVYYQYDGLDRLSLVRDQDNNVIKKICYNYLGQPEDCSQAVYWNRGGSMLYTKNNCDSGYTGTSVVYSVAAGLYSSTVSQFHADSLAWADLDPDGQAYANTHGSCVPIYFNVLKSGSFSRNNCDSGYITDPMTYTVMAGVYSSLISQAHADSLAQADVDANGQAYANTHGSCTIYCVDCSGRNKRCINFVCETGIKVYTTSEWDSEMNKYRCYYHYEFSDGSWSLEFSEYSNTQCISE